MRIVEYVADSNGFRTRIRSNEPGLMSSNPANAGMKTDECFNSFVDFYTFHRNHSIRR